MSDQVKLSPSTLLLGAANLIRLRGHCRGTFQNNKGAMCVRGAIQRYAAEAVTWPDEDDAVWPAVNKQVHDCVSAAEAKLVRLIPTVDPACCPIATWNDHVCASGEEAAALLERAAGLI